VQNFQSIFFFFVMDNSLEFSYENLFWDKSRIKYFEEVIIQSYSLQMPLVCLKLDLKPLTRYYLPKVLLKSPIRIPKLYIGPACGA
jgi:hypothetical protein